MVRWEYTVARIENDELLIALGEHGWELVAILPNYVAYFKRPIHSAIPEAKVPGTHWYDAFADKDRG